MGAITRGIANNILGNGAVDGTDALTGTIPATNIGNPSLANLTTFPPSVDAGIPQVAGDPPSPSDGDVWYNTNTYKLKVRGVSAVLGSWSSGGTMNTTRAQLAGAGTSYTAALAFGGDVPPGTGATESYNGTAWTEVNDLNNAVAINSGAGTATSALNFGGELPPGTLTNKSESWNGSSWTEVANMNTSRRDPNPAGADNTSALSTAGRTPPSAATANCEQWNGSSWTEINNINSARYGGGGNGIVTSALLYGGYTAPDPRQAKTELWNGSAWTEVNDLNNGVSSNKGAGTDNTAAMSIGGYITASVAQTEVWNGTSWTISPGSLNTAKYGAGADGTTNLAFYAGGTDGTAKTAATEEWNAGDANLNVDLA